MPNEPTQNLVNNASYKPNRFKLMMLTWAAAYPTILVLLVILEPALAGQPLPVRVLILSSMMVPIMSYMIMPWLTSICRNWLSDGHSL